MSMEYRLDIYKFIVDYMIENIGLPPTNREIVSGTTISSTSVATYNKDRLHDAGLIKIPRTFEEKDKKISRKIHIPGSVFAVPRNVILGNINNVTETSVFIDRSSEHAAALMEKFGGSEKYSAHWFQDDMSWDIAVKMLHHKQLAVITDHPKITLMAIAYNAAVYLPENIL